MTERPLIHSSSTLLLMDLLEVLGLKLNILKMVIRLGLKKNLILKIRMDYTIISQRGHVGIFQP